MPKTEALLTARRDELAAGRDAILERSAPLRAERERVGAEARRAVSALDERIAEAEAGLYAVTQDLSRVARALGARTLGRR